MLHNCAVYLEPPHSTQCQVHRAANPTDTAKMVSTPTSHSGGRAPQIPKFLKAQHEVEEHPDTDRPAAESRSVTAHPVPYDENLLERARTQWQFGDWGSLVKLERETLQHHPDRAMLALLAAAGRLQTDKAADARQFVRLAQDWGAGRKLISQILIAGVHNSLGRAAALADDQARALKHFESAIVVGSPGTDARLIIQARIVHQLDQLGFAIHPEGLSRIPTQRGGLSAAVDQSHRPASENALKHVATNANQDGSDALKIAVDLEKIEEKAAWMPDEDFASERYDVPTHTVTRNVLVVFSTPRTGSTLLCDLLRINNICLPHEYFQPYEYMPLLAKRWGCIEGDEIDAVKYVERLCRFRTFGNGWLGINLHGSHLQVFSRLKHLMPEVNFHYWHLLRKDIVSQGVSYSIAQQTKKWTSHHVSLGEPIYDFKAINEAITRIAKQNELIDSYVTTEMIECSKIFYEDLVYDFGHIEKLVGQLSANFCGSIRQSVLQKQASFINDVFKENYCKELLSRSVADEVGMLRFLNKQPSLAAQ